MFCVCVSWCVVPPSPLPAKGPGTKVSLFSLWSCSFSLQPPPTSKSFWLVFSLRGKGACSNNPASLVCCRHRDCCHRLFSSAVPAALMRGMCCLMQHFIPSVCPARGAVHCIAVLFLRKVLHQAAQGMWC